MRHRRFDRGVAPAYPGPYRHGGLRHLQAWVEWRQHSSHFASGSHLMFSVRHEGEHPSAPITSRDVDQARTQAWWGDPLVVWPDRVVTVRPEAR